MDISNKHAYAIPRLAVFFGVPGAGKTTLADAVLRSISGAYVNKDSILAAFTSDVEGDFYRKLARPATYQIMWNIASDNLMQGQTVILEAPFNDILKGERNADIESISRETGSLLKLIHCAAPDETIRQRLAHRAEPRDRWKLDNWEEYVAKAHAIDIKVPHLHIDTTGDIRSNVKRVIDYISG